MVAGLGKTYEIAAIFSDSCSNAARFLCNPDCVAERERFEPSVQLSSARHYREHREVKPGSQSLRFVIANNSPTQVCKVGSFLGSWRKRAIECLVVTQQPFSPLGLSEKLSQNTGNFFCFVGDSVRFLCGRD